MSLEPRPMAVDAPADRRRRSTPPTGCRRTRRTEALRELVRETRIHPRQLVAPIFVRPGRGLREPVGSMPGVERVSPDEASATSSGSRRWASAA